MSMNLNPKTPHVVDRNRVRKQVVRIDPSSLILTGDSEISGEEEYQDNSELEEEKDDGEEEEAEEEEEEEDPEEDEEDDGNQGSSQSIEDEGSKGKTESVQETSKDERYVQTVAAVFDFFGDTKPALLFKIQECFFQCAAQKFRSENLVNLKANFFLNHKGQTRVDRDIYHMCGFHDVGNNDFLFVL